TARYSAAVATGADGRIYVIGGCARGGFPDVAEAYSPDTDTWETLAPPPVPRCPVSAAAGRDGRIYVLGGGDGSDLTRRVDVYSPTSDTWDIATPTSALHREGAAAAAADRIFALGGFTSAVESARVH